MAAARVKRVDGIIIEIKEQDKRRCIGHCREWFVPEYKGLHICPSCTRQNEGIDGREYRIVGGFKD